MKKRNGEKNRRGVVQLPMWDPHEDQFQEGTRTGKAVEESGGQSPVYHEVDTTLEMFYAPPLTSVLQSIMVEIAEEREAGVVRPFIERSLPSLIQKRAYGDTRPIRRRGLGEPIGKVKRKERPFMVTYLESPARRWERVQEEIKALRKQNNRAIARFLEE